MQTISISDARLAANRRNVQASRGPVSIEGKRIELRNSTRHGMTSSAILLRDEDPKVYAELVSSTMEDLAPQSGRERNLAVNVANTIWRRDRMYRTEAATWTLGAKQVRARNPEITTDDEARAWMLLDPMHAKQTSLMLRCVTACERACEKAIREYRDAVAQRFHQQHGPAPVPVAMQPAARNAAKHDFVSSHNVIAFARKIVNQAA